MIGPSKRVLRARAMQGTQLVLTPRAVGQRLVITVTRRRGGPYGKRDKRSWVFTWNMALRVISTMPLTTRVRIRTPKE